LAKYSIKTDFFNRECRIIFIGFKTKIAFCWDFSCWNTI